MPGQFGKPTTIGPYQGIFETSTTQKHKLGEKLQLYDGRVFYYAKASEALSKSKLATFKSTINAEDTVTVAHAIGVNKVKVTAAAAISANQFAEGYLVVDEGTGAGDVYKIKGHPAISSGSVGEIELYDGLRTAWATADTDVILYQNPFSEIQEANTDGIELPAGVPLVDVSANEYFWLQTWGWAAVLIDGTAGALGNLETERLLTISGTAGAVDVYTATGRGAGSPIVGQALMDAADYEDAKYQLILLQIMP